MTPQQALLVKNSFKKVAPNLDLLAENFYDCLFEIAPETRALFPADMVAQHHKFAALLSIIGGTIDRFDELEKRISNLGARHAQYKARDEHFGAVGEALLITLKMHFGEAFTSELKYAWTAAYWRIALIMQDAAEAEGLSRRRQA
ncbi:MAG: globin domain-containing protein [Proteobacteria bacterium]|nr:globin domain-containing protein [Pseudomonadota bacterium]